MPFDMNQLEPSEIIELAYALAGEMDKTASAEEEEHRTKYVRGQAWPGRSGFHGSEPTAQSKPQGVVRYKVPWGGGKVQGGKVHGTI